MAFGPNIILTQKRWLVVCCLKLCFLLFGAKISLDITHTHKHSLRHTQKIWHMLIY